MSKVERARVEDGTREPEAYGIEPMTAHDLLEVVEIEEASGLSRWGWDSYHDELSRPEAVVLVARLPTPDAEGKYLLGFIAARIGVDELHVNNIGVRERARRRGIGSVLLSSAIETGVSKGARTALLEVRAGNAPAQALYARHEFEIVGRRRNYYHDPTEDALVMSRVLRHPT